MNPDVVRAITRLRADGVLSAGQADLFDRVARRGLVSVRFEIRALLYVGVLLLTSGVGVLVAQHHQEIGPLAIATGITLAAARLPALGRAPGRALLVGRGPSPSVAFDYVLLLGLLLLASALAYVEVQFTVLGPRWAYHLLIVGVVYLLAAYRWDSRTALGLALATLAAWRGLSISLVPAATLGPGVAADLRASAIALGALYVGAAVLSVRLGRKAHFEEVFANAGLLLLLGGLLSGVLEDHRAWSHVARRAAGGGGRRHGGRLPPRPLALLRGRPRGRLHRARARALRAVPLRAARDSIPLLLAALLGSAVLAVIFWAHRRMRER